MNPRRYASGIALRTALEQRLREIARQEVGALDIGDFFTFRAAEASIDLDGAPSGGARYPVEAVLGGRTFVKFHLDIGIGDVVLDPVETVEPRDWLAFAQIPPPRVPMISREQQFAEKLHAYTLPRPVSPNSRVRDLVDMVLLIESGTLSPEKVREALSRTFERRGTHGLPGTLTPPPEDWEEPFRALAEECRLTASLAQAFEGLRRFHAGLA